MSTITKNVSLRNCQVKFAGNDAMTFEGYASVFGGVDSYNDTIMRGAYSDLLEKIGNYEEEMPKMFINHRSWGIPPGKWITLEEDEYGLMVKGEFTPGNQEADQVRAAMQHGTVDGLSIGFQLGDYEMVEDPETRAKIRVIKSIKALPEISIVTYPADDAARIDLTSVKSALENCNTLAELETFLRDVGGFSKALATATASRAKRIALQSDSDNAEMPNDLKKQIYANLLFSKTL
jgi:HK97 family phage prohead protease